MQSGAGGMSQMGQSLPESTQDKLLREILEELRSIRMKLVHK